MEAQALLKLQQMFDSQFPLGGFAHSWGIETYSHLGLDTQGLERLLRNMMTAGWGKLDLAAAALAHRKAGDALALERLAGEVDAMKVVAGPREASLQLGRRTLGLMDRLHPGVCPGVSPPHHCVVVGAVGAALGVPRGSCWRPLPNPAPWPAWPPLFGVCPWARPKPRKS